MKTTVLVIIGISAVAGMIVCLNRSKPSAAAPVATVQSVLAPAKVPRPATPIAAPVEPTPAVVAATAEPADSPAPESKPVDPAAAALSKSIDFLCARGVDLAEKQATWKRLQDSGQLDSAVAELKQRAADHPDAAEIPTALGEAYLQKARTMPGYNDRGIMALQADQSFDEALRLAPTDWEAQFYKAVALAGWPDGLNKGPEVIQRFTDLINQQESMPSRPEFARSYVVLGNQYQKAGNPDYAQAVWQAGAALFPANQELAKKLAANH